MNIKPLLTLFWHALNGENIQKTTVYIFICLQNSLTILFHNEYQKVLWLCSMYNNTSEFFQFGFIPSNTIKKGNSKSPKIIIRITF